MYLYIMYFSLNRQLCICKQMKRGDIRKTIINGLVIASGIVPKDSFGLIVKAHADTGEESVRRLV